MDDINDVLVAHISNGKIPKSVRKAIKNNCPVMLFDTYERHKVEIYVEFHNMSNKLRAKCAYIAEEALKDDNTAITKAVYLQ